MSETNESKKRSRLRWVTLGEAIAIAALVLSGLGLWHEWGKQESKPAVTEKPASIPLALRGKVTKEGRELEISPIEDSHALQSLSVIIGSTRIELGSDGELDSEDVEAAIGEVGRDEGTHRLPVRIAARYVEAGADKTATGSYTLSYRWKDRLIGSSSLRFTGLSRG